MTLQELAHVDHVLIVQLPIMIQFRGGMAGQGEEVATVTCRFVKVP